MKKRYLYPDIMRTAAMLLIFVYHFFVEFSRRVDSVTVPRIFTDERILTSHPVSVAVSLFFLISGASLMLSARPDESALSFYRRRFRSLMIPFYAVFIAGFVMTWLVYAERYAGIPAWTIVLSLIGMDGYLLEAIPNFYVTGEWFLGCLILLYLCFPLLKKCVEKQPVVTAAATLILFIVLLAFFDVPLFAERDRWFFFRLPEFMLGMYLSRYLKDCRKWYFPAAGFIMLLPWFFAFVPERFELLQRLVIVAGIYLIMRFLGEIIEGKVRFLEDWIHDFSGISYHFFLIHHFLILVAAGIIANRGFRIGTGREILLLMLVICILGAALLKKILSLLFPGKPLPEGPKEG